MYYSKFIKSTLLSVVIVIISALPVFSFSDQITTERILKENKVFVEFINVCISNFAADKETEFMKSYEKHFNAEIAFLQSDYKRAFKRIYSSQGDMVELYRYILKNLYLMDSKEFLDKMAPDIIRSKNATARLYLTLAYRDRTVSWTHYTVGEASNPRLHSYKLFKFVEGIKMARRSKRYGFLALFASQKPEKKRQIYNQLLKGENEKGNLFFKRFAGLKDKEYIDQMNLSYKQYQEKNPVPPEAATFERKLEKKVRFRKEKRTADFLVNHDFDQAEDIMRKYVDDFNFKLTDATLTVLSGEGSEAGHAPVDYKKMRIHLLDNYSRLSSASVLDGLMKKVRVEDEVPSEKKEVKPSVEKKTEAEDHTEENKDNKENKQIDESKPK